MSRSVGIKRDLRLSRLETYSNYYFLNIRGFLGQHGDSYDRFLIRMNEMAESLNIINQVIYKIIKHKNNNSSINNISPHNIIKYTNSIIYNKHNSKDNYNSMEHLIKHFKHWSEGNKVETN